MRWPHILDLAKFSLVFCRFLGNFCVDMSSVNRDSFISSFPICLPFFFCLALFYWLRLPVQCWIGVVIVGILVLCPVPLFGVVGECSFSLLSIWCQCEVFCRCPLSGWGNSLLFLVLLIIFIMNGFWILWNAFPPPIDMILWCFRFGLFIWEIITMGFGYWTSLDWVGW